jgi:hypothetical protein
VQSKILTLDEYTTAAKELKLSKELAQRAKEQQHCEKQDLKKKEMECEEGCLAREVAREEAARLKELRLCEPPSKQSCRPVGMPPEKRPNACVRNASQTLQRQRQRRQ